MNDHKVIFVVETNYQLLYSIIINFYLKLYNVNTLLISACISNDVQELSRKITCFDDVMYFDRSNNGNMKLDLIEEIKFVFDNQKVFKKMKGSTLIVFKDANYLQGYLLSILKKDKTSKTVLVEEGLSMYEERGGVHRLTIKNKVKRVVRIALMRLLKAKKVTYGFGYNDNLDYLAVYSPDKLDEVKVIGKEVIRLPHVAPDLAVFNVMEEYFLDDSVENIIDEEKQSIMYFGQLMVENGKVDKKREEFFLNYLSNISEEYNIQVIIKPHPRENVEKFKMYSNVIVVDNRNIPAEVLFNKIKPSAILTPYSTASMNISRWWNVNSAYTFKLIDLEIDINLLDNQTIVEEYDDLREWIQKSLSSVEIIKSRSGVEKNENEYMDLVRQFL